MVSKFEQNENFSCYLGIKNMIIVFRSTFLVCF